VGLRNHILDGIKIGRIHLQLWGVTRWRCQSTFDVCLYIWLTHGIDSHQTLWLISCCTGTSTLTYSRESGRNIVWSPQVHQCTRSGWHFHFHQIFTKFMMLPLASVLPLYLNTCHFVCLDALVKHRREAASLWDTWYFSFSKIYKKIMYGSFMKLGKWLCCGCWIDQILGCSTKIGEFVYILGVLLFPAETCKDNWSYWYCFRAYQNVNIAVIVNHLGGHAMQYVKFWNFVGLLSELWQNCLVDQNSYRCGNYPHRLDFTLQGALGTNCNNGFSVTVA